MEMHLVRVILGESKAKEVLKMRKENKNSSKGKVTVKANSKDNMAVKADNRAETSKKASSKGKETVSYSKDKVAMLKANSRTRWLYIVMEMHPVRVISEDSKVKSQQKTTDKRQQTTVRATKGMN